jgi:hypothetical protein
MFLVHLSHARDLRLHGRLGRAQVVAQTIAQVILPVGSDFFVVAITLVMDFILLKHGDFSGENRGNSAEWRS